MLAPTLSKTVGCEAPTAPILTNGVPDMRVKRAPTNPFILTLNNFKALMELLIDNLAGVVQYNGRSGRTSIADVCEIMENENGGRAIGKSTLHCAVLI